jgi:hypothetical protein
MFRLSILKPLSFLRILENIQLIVRILNKCYVNLISLVTYLTQTYYNVYAWMIVTHALNLPLYE